MAEITDGLWFRGITEVSAKEWIQKVLAPGQPKTFSQASVLLDPQRSIPRTGLLRMFKYLGIGLDQPRMFHPHINRDEEEDVIYYTRNIIKASPLQTYNNFLDECKERAVALPELQNLLTAGSPKSKVFEQAKERMLPGVDKMKLNDFVLP